MLVSLAFTCPALAPGYAECMFRLRFPPSLFMPGALFVSAFVPSAIAQSADASWNFAVSGDSRNCGDFVMPAIAAKVNAEKDDFYWHLGDFRAMSSADQDLLAMQTPGIPLSKAEYQQHALADFLDHQIAP